MHLSDKLLKCKEVKVFAGSAQPQSLKWNVTHLIHCFMAKSWKLLVKYKYWGGGCFETFDGERSECKTTKEGEN